ncbi:hypothetical protein ColLi_03756 [Colletotrichum liriopes]|uniref:Uncharacterized protein n=1 Tax=Colletotrichum liriopes TaxID=708192 RepID=A0AA37GII8_9PEZI|nr:hypothetical protein ColLi_03756 [Colletotrichum liriopes]
MAYYASPARLSMGRTAGPPDPSLALLEGSLFSFEPRLSHDTANCALAAHVGESKTALVWGMLAAVR